MDDYFSNYLFYKFGVCCNDPKITYPFWQCNFLFLPSNFRCPLHAVILLLLHLHAYKHIPVSPAHSLPFHSSLGEPLFPSWPSGPPHQLDLQLFLVRFLPTKRIPGVGNREHILRAVRQEEFQYSYQHCYLCIIAEIFSFSEHSVSFLAIKGAYFGSCLPILSFTYIKNGQYMNINQEYCFLSCFSLTLGFLN